MMRAFPLRMHDAGNWNGLHSLKSVACVHQISQKSPEFNELFDPPEK